MRVGSFKFGNDYNFKPENVQLKMKVVTIREDGGRILRVRVPENRHDLLSLDKVEIRYNVRKGQPDYKAMKSLYKLRSVFGYRLGGAIRKAFVKLSEITRHKENFLTLTKALRHTDRLDKHTRMYSTSDIIFAAKQSAHGKLDTLKYLKYQTWDQHDVKAHKLAEMNDYSFRKLVVDGAKNLFATRTSGNSFLEMGKETEKRFAEKNRVGEATFNREKTMQMENLKNRIVSRETETANGDFKYFDRQSKDPRNLKTDQEEFAKKAVQAQDRLKWLHTASYEQLANDEQIKRLNPEMQTLAESVFVPEKPTVSSNTFKTAASSQNLDNRVGGFGRFIQGNSPIALIKRGVNYITCSLEPKRHHYDNINKEKMLNELQLDRRVDTQKRLNGKEPSMRELLENIRFDGKLNVQALSGFTLDGPTKERHEQMRTDQVNERVQALKDQKPRPDLVIARPKINDGADEI
jgi:hypothetical protein